MLFWFEIWRGRSYTEGMLVRFLALSLLMSFSHLLADELAPLQAALDKQAGYKTVKVTVRQTKTVPALTEKSVMSGQLWLQPGKAFHWQLGKPAVQTAVYDGNKVYLMDDTQKTAMELDTEDRRAKSLMLMLGIGRAATAAGLREAFTVQETNQVGDQFVVSLRPKGGLKRALTSMILQVNTRTSFPERIEWTQRDGTVVVTEFAIPAFNQPFPVDLLKVKREGYTWE